MIAASLHTFFISAPLNPGVRVASLLEYYLISALAYSLNGLR